MPLLPCIMRVKRILEDLDKEKPSRLLFELTRIDGQSVIEVYGDPLCDRPTPYIKSIEVTNSFELTITCVLFPGFRGTSETISIARGQILELNNQTPLRIKERQGDNPTIITTLGADTLIKCLGTDREIRNNLLGAFAELDTHVPHLQELITHIAIELDLESF